VRALTSRAAPHPVPLPAAFAAAIEAALAADPALAVASVEEVQEEYTGAAGEPMTVEELRAATEAGRFKDDEEEEVVGEDGRRRKRKKKKEYKKRVGGVEGGGSEVGGARG